MTSASGDSIAITGATGHIGGRVVRELASRSAGTPLRAIVRDPSRAPALPGVDVAAASFGDRAASVAALRGIDVLLMVSAAEAPDRLAQHLDFVAAAAEAGVRHVVYTSFIGAAPDAIFTLARDHFATEEAIREAGLDFTILRDSFYLDFVAELVGEDGVIRGPAARGRMAAVARADVASSASAILRSPRDHVGATYDLTGPAAFDLDEAAAAVGRATGRDVRFHDETLDEAYRSRERWNPEPWQADAWVSTYTSIASGELERVSPDVERLTGRSPLSLEQVLRA